MITRFDEQLNDELPQRRVVCIKRRVRVAACGLVMDGESHEGGTGEARSEKRRCDAMRCDCERIDVMV
jgi:hypothetical protein